ncbi:ankyrin repeat and fibronectin type-III domain-containing protein 1-like isoform X2 [Bradysia coprophila]|nr:ankyrin repeat and fibronectin type-III domain-containing protein 1-like isoform X2 [Bradysia coprophila]
MEYFIPYARLKNVPQNGMQLTTVKRNEQAPTTNATTTVVSANVVSSKKIQKHVLNQQFSNLKGSEIEFPPRKMSKKQLKVAQDQLKKLTKINIHLSALFAAVENGQTDRAKSILESTDVNVNCTNSDALSPLDVAVLSNNRSLTKILLEYGASHGVRFKTCESMGYHLNTLLEDALNKINDFTCGSHDDLGDDDADKQIDFWQKRANSLQRILRGWVQSTAPNMPNSVVVDVTSSTSVAVKVQEALAGAITTKFKIQWSLTEDFVNIIDEREINDLTSSQGVMFSTFHLYNLIHGQRYYFRALSGNLKGWSEHCSSSPLSVIPSSWQDIATSAPCGSKKTLDDLMVKLSAVRMASLEIPLDSTASNGLFIKKKATIKQLFTATSKFQKQLKRGLYLACLLYHDGKVLVTNDDTLPVIEIDENYPNNFCSELPWLMKVSCNWDIVKAMRNEIEKHSSSTSQFRLKILSAISQMQSVMGLKDLGFVYYKFLQDSQGTVVISFVNHIKNPKSISVLNSRWIPLRKIQRKLPPIGDESNINDIILASIPNQIEFLESGCSKLAKGLYVGYLQMHCSMEQMQIVIPTKTPNVLPHQKIRDNPHVCAEEWEALQDTFNQNQRTEMQQKFVGAISSAAWRLFKYMGKSTESILKHKLYNMELIKLSHDVSFLIVCPPIETSCSLVPGQREMMLQRPDLVSVSTHAFEMCQLFTYDSEAIRKCARLSLVLDLEISEANYSHREAFSAVEIEAAKERLDRLQVIRAEVFEFWKNMRWLMDVMTFSRNRCSDTGISMRSILNLDSSQTEPVVLRQREKLDRPSDNVTVTRRSPCRLSWPNNNRKDQVTSVLSKSDQQLNFVMSKVHYKQKTDDGLRRNSADAKYHGLQASEESLNRLAFVDHYSLSKSEEVLSSSAPSFSPLLQRKRSKTINARICSLSCSECRNSSAHTDHAKGSEPSENESSATTCSVSSYLTDEDGKTTKIESNMHAACDKENFDDDNTMPQLGTIQVYFTNGGDNGISLQLHITTKTTAREIIDLVLSHCSPSILAIDEKPATCNQLASKDFCLFAIFGNRGRCVPNNFRPLQLQNPWKKGRLYVRRNRDFLAEIDRSDRDVHTI